MHDLIKRQHVRRVRLLALLASSGLVLAPTLARADDFQGLGFLPGGSNSAALGMSADGTVVVGESTIAGNVATHAFRWSGGAMSDLGTLAGGTNSCLWRFRRRQRGGRPIPQLFGSVRRSVPLEPEHGHAVAPKPAGRQRRQHDRLDA